MHHSTGTVVLYAVYCYYLIRAVVLMCKSSGLIDEHNSNHNQCINFSQCIVYVTQKIACLYYVNK